MLSYIINEVGRKNMYKVGTFAWLKPCTDYILTARLMLRTWKLRDDCCMHTKWRVKYLAWNASSDQTSHSQSLKKADWYRNDKLSQCWKIIGRCACGLISIDRPVSCPNPEYIQSSLLSLRVHTYHPSFCLWEDSRVLLCSVGLKCSL